MAEEQTREFGKLVVYGNETMRGQSVLVAEHLGPGAKQFWANFVLRDGEEVTAVVPKIKEGSYVLQLGINRLVWVTIFAGEEPTEVDWREEAKRRF